MTRALAVLAAAVLFLVPVLQAPETAVAVLGGAGVALAVAGIAGRWPRLVAVAAALFVSGYAVAVRGPTVPASILPAAGFGLALLLLLQAADLARGARRAVVDPGVVRARTGAWVGLGAATVGATMLGTGVARGLAESVPHEAAPFVAAAGALGILLAMAAIVRQSRQ